MPSHGGRPSCPRWLRALKALCGREIARRPYYPPRMEILEAIEAANNLLALLPPAAFYGPVAASIVQTPSDCELSFDLGDASAWSLTPGNPALADALFLPPATPTTAAPPALVSPTPPAYIGAFGDTLAPPDWASSDLQTSPSAPVAPAAPTGAAADSAVAPPTNLAAPTGNAAGGAPTAAAVALPGGDRQ